MIECWGLRQQFWWCFYSLPPRSLKQKWLASRILQHPTLATWRPFQKACFGRNRVRAPPASRLASIAGQPVIECDASCKSRTRRGRSDAWNAVARSRRIYLRPKVTRENGWTLVIAFPSCSGCVAGASASK